MCKLEVRSGGAVFGNRSIPGVRFVPFCEPRLRIPWGSSGPRSPVMLLISAILVIGGAHQSIAQTAVYYTDRFSDSADSSKRVCDLNVDNDCSLRGAIIKANGDGVDSEIRLKAGTYTLSIAGADEDSGFFGDLDVTEPLVITTALETGTVVIRQTVDDRVLHLNQVSGPVRLVGDITLEGGRAGAGGILHSQFTPSLTLEGTTLRGGQAEAGGCLYAWNEDSLVLTLTEVEFDGCITDNYGGGASAYVGSGSLSARVTKSHFHHNVAGYGGGFYADGYLLVTDSTFSANRSESVDAAGGAFYIGPNGQLTLQNSTVSGNSVVGTTCRGSAVHLNGNADVDLTHATITNNFGSGGCGSIAAISTESGSWIRSRSSIIDGGCSGGGATTSSGYNVENSWGGGSTTSCGLTKTSDLIVADVLLRPLAGYGGPTPTHKPFVGSPVIDNVPDSACSSHDQRAAQRIGSTCDAGSVEYGAQPPGMWIFEDGFESGGSFAWSGAVGPV